MDVVIGVDAHKKTHTLVAVNKVGRQLGQNTIATTSAAHGQGVRWARSRFGTDLVWGVEDCRALTARLERDLMAEGRKRQAGTGPMSAFRGPKVRFCGYPTGMQK